MWVLQSKLHIKKNLKISKKCYLKYLVSIKEEYFMKKDEKSIYKDFVFIMILGLFNILKE